MKVFLTLLATIAILTGCQSGKVFSYQPQVWKSEGFSVSVTRPGMASSTDTTREADTYCAEFGRVAKLTKLANPLQLPMRDEFECVEKTTSE